MWYASLIIKIDKFRSSKSTSWFITQFWKFRTMTKQHVNSTHPGNLNAWSKQSVSFLYHIVSISQMVKTGRVYYFEEHRKSIKYMNVNTVICLFQINYSFVVVTFLSTVPNEKKKSISLRNNTILVFNLFFFSTIMSDHGINFTCGTLTYRTGRMKQWNKNYPKSIQFLNQYGIKSMIMITTLNKFLFFSSLSPLNNCWRCSYFNVHSLFMPTLLPFYKCPDMFVNPHYS